MTNTEPKSKIDTLIRTYKMLARVNRAQPEARQSQTLYFQLLTDYYTRIRNAHEEGKLLALRGYWEVDDPRNTMIEIDIDDDASVA